MTPMAPMTPMETSREARRRRDVRVREGDGIRTVKPEWLEDERMAAASDAARVLSIGLILLADDHGRGRAAPAYIASKIWGYADDSRESREGLGRIARARDALAELAAIEFVQLYSVDGQSYYAIRSWRRHQRVDHPGQPRVPLPPVASSVELPAVEVELQPVVPPASSAELPVASPSSAELPAPPVAAIVEPVAPAEAALNLHLG